MSSEELKTKEKRPWERIVYNVLIWSIPVFYLNIFPWIRMLIEKFLFVNEANPFEINFMQSYIIYQLNSIIVPAFFNFIVGAALLFLGSKMKENMSAITFWGSLINCVYVVFIIIGTIKDFGFALSLGIGEYRIDRGVLLLGAYAFLFIINLKKKAEQS